MAQVLERLRRDALSILRSGVKAASPENAIRRALSLEDKVLSVGAKQYDLNTLRGIVLLGGGKASRGMALTLWRLLGDRVREGFLSVPYGQGGIFENLHILEASHPLPDERGLDNTRRIIHSAENIPEGHLVIFLVSGGASSLLVAPPDGVTLKEVAALNRELLVCGADVREMNRVRRHVCDVKGGKLAQKVHPAPFITLIISDVPGDDPSDVGSGPTVPDPTTYLDAQRVMDKYGLGGRISPSIVDHIRKGVEGRLAENPKDTDAVFSSSESLVIADNTDAVRAACARAERLGYRVLPVAGPVTGDTKAQAALHAEMARRILRGDGPVDPPACVVSGGETTLKIKGGGRGGRNQEFCLHATSEISGLPIVFLSADTDGSDGSTDAAGAICDGQTQRRARAERMSPANYLKNNDSYRFFQRLGDLVKTGPTGTNVMDVHILMVAEEGKVG